MFCYCETRDGEDTNTDSKLRPFADDRICNCAIKDIEDTNIDLELRIFADDCVCYCAIRDSEDTNINILTRKSELIMLAGDFVCYCEIRDCENKVKLQDDERMIMKGCMQWNPVYSQEDFRFQWAPIPGPRDQQAIIDPLRYEAPLQYSFTIWYW